MELAVRMQGESRIVAVPGPRLDAAGAEDFRAAMREVIDGGATRVVIDLSGIEFLDSSGLGALVACLKHMGERGRLELAAPREPVLKVLRLTRMNTVFTIHDRIA
jgi:anti-sigma B factor antagonist